MKESEFKATKRLLYTLTVYIMQVIALRHCTWTGKEDNCSKLVCFVIFYSIYVESFSSSLKNRDFPQAPLHSIFWDQGHTNELFLGEQLMHIGHRCACVSSYSVAFIKIKFHLKTVIPSHGDGVIFLMILVLLKTKLNKSWPQ